MKRSGNNFTPSQLIPIYRLARNLPYIVHEVQFNDFLDFKILSLDLGILKTRQTDQEVAYLTSLTSWRLIWTVKLNLKQICSNSILKYITEKRTTHTETSEKAAFHNQRLIEIEINRPI